MHIQLEHVTSNFEQGREASNNYSITGIDPFLATTWAWTWNIRSIHTQEERTKRFHLYDSRGALPRPVVWVSYTGCLQKVVVYSQSILVFLNDSKTFLDVPNISYWSVCNLLPRELGSAAESTSDFVVIVVVETPLDIRNCKCPIIERQAWRLPVSTL